MATYGFCENKCKQELDTVKVSSEEPTTNEKIWIQKGKNLVDSSKLKHGYSFSDQGELEEYSSYFVTDYIEVLPNEDYCSSGFKNSLGNEYKAKIFFDENYNFISRVEENPVKAPSNAKYVRLEGYTENSSNLQLEQSSTVTEYEAYIEKVIKVKNANGSYESFYNEKSFSPNLYSEEHLEKNLHFYKLGRMVFVSGLYPINGNSATFEVPYTPEEQIRFPVTSGDSSEEADNSFGRGLITKEGICSLKMNGTVTYAYMSFSYKAIC